MDLEVREARVCGDNKRAKRALGVGITSAQSAH